MSEKKERKKERLQVPGRVNQQQPILQQPHSEYNYLSTSVPWLPQEKHKVHKSRIKRNGTHHQSGAPTPKVILPGLKWFNVERPAGLLVNTPHMQV